VPPAADVFDVSRKPLHDPIEEAQRREDLTRLVEDVGRLPEQQRSALLMREIDGMSYADLADALDVTVPAVKSLLVRARVGLVEAAEARDADCCEIRDDLMASYDKGVKASGRARRHMRACAGCREYRTALRGMRRSFAALTPVSAGLFGSIAASVGLGGGGAAAGGAAAGGGGAVAAATGGTLVTATACKVAAVVCTAALTAGGAVEVGHKLKHRSAPAPDTAVAAAPALAPSPPAPMPAKQLVHRATSLAPAAATAPAHKAKERSAPKKAEAKVEKAPATTVPVGDDAPATGATPIVTAPETSTPVDTSAGGVAAPDEPETSTGSPSTGNGDGSASAPVTESPGTTAPTDTTGTTTPPAGDDGAPPSEH